VLSACLLLYVASLSPRQKRTATCAPLKNGHQLFSPTRPALLPVICCRSFQFRQLPRPSLSPLLSSINRFSPLFLSYLSPCAGMLCSALSSLALLVFCSLRAWFLRRRLPVLRHRRMICGGGAGDNDGHQDFSDEAMRRLMFDIDPESEEKGPMYFVSFSYFCFRLRKACQSFSGCFVRPRLDEEDILCLGFQYQSPTSFVNPACSIRVCSGLGVVWYLSHRGQGWTEFSGETSCCDSQQNTPDGCSRHDVHETRVFRI